MVGHNLLPPPEEDRVNVPENLGKAARSLAIFFSSIARSARSAQIVENNFVDRILPFFDPLPPDPSSCPRSY